MVDTLGVSLILTGGCIIMSHGHYYYYWSRITYSVEKYMPRGRRKSCPNSCTPHVKQVTEGRA